MRTATQATCTPDLRKNRAQFLTSALMQALGPCLPPDTDLRGVTGVIYTFFHEAGFDIISDRDREAAGIPPRNGFGYTDDELAAMEQVRESLFAPRVPDRN